MQGQKKSKGKKSARTIALQQQRQEGVQRHIHPKRKSFASKQPVHTTLPILHQIISSHSFSTSSPLKKVSSFQIFTRFFPALKRKKKEGQQQKHR